MLILCVTIFLPTTVSTGLQGMPCQLESQVHSTNTLIDEVGLVEMEVGLDQLTWGDADLQRELRRLKDNSLKIPNLKYIFKIALLRVIPTLTHYSDIVSDISSGRICGIYVLTYYLTFFSEILFDILSGILSGIYSDILSGIYYILILPCHEFGLGVLLFAWINANGLNIHQMLVSHVCTQWLPLPLIPQNGQVLNLRVGPEKFSGYWKNRTLAQGLKKDVGGRFRYAVGLQSWVNLNLLSLLHFELILPPSPSLFQRLHGNVSCIVLRVFANAQSFSSAADVSGSAALAGSKQTPLSCTVLLRC